ncbi:MAG: choice-of-anchor D domain-containing protein [Acidimicrobiales bacterium]
MLAASPPAGATSLPASLWVEDTRVDLGPVDVGRSATVDVTVRNPGDLDLAALSVGAPSGSFSRSTTCPASLAAGATCTVSIAFVPTATGPASSSLTVASAAGSASVAVEGRGVDPTYPLLVDPTGLDFGTLVTPSTSTVQQVVIANTSSAPQSFTIAGLVTTGEFTTDPANCTASPKVLAAGASCHLDVRMAATTVADHTGALSFDLQVVGGLTQHASIPLSGTSVRGLTVYPYKLDFGSIPVGSTSASRTVTLKNTGSPISFTSLTAPTTSGYTPSVSCPANGVLPTNGTCTVTYTYTPATATSNNIIGTTLTLTTTSGATYTNTVNLSGRGATTLRVMPTTVNFGDVVTGTTAGPQTITVTNTSSGGVAYDPSSSVPSGPYAITGTTCGGGWLDAGESCTYSVTYRPTAVGTNTATASLVWDFTESDATTQTNSITLTGKGVASTATQTPITVTDRNLPFGTVFNGSSASYDVLVRNVSGVAQPVTLTGGTPSNAAYALDNQCGASFTLPVGGSCTLRYTYTAGSTSPNATSSLTLVAGSFTVSSSISLSATSASPVVATVAGADFGFAWIQTAACQLGQIFCGSQPTADITLENVTGSSVSYTSGNTAPPTGMAVLSNGCTGSPKVLAAGASCTIRLQASPQAVGQAISTGGQQITPANGVVYSTQIPGTVIGAFPFRLEGLGHDFGDVTVGATATKSVGIVNVSPFNQASPSRSTTQPADDAMTSSVGCSPFGILIGSGCSLNLVYAPTAAGATSDSTDLTVTVGSATKVWNFRERAYARPAEPDLVVAHRGIDLGPVGPGSTTSRTISLRNAGRSAINGLTINNPSGSGITLSGSCGTLAAGATCDLTASMTGNGSGAHASLSPVLRYDTIDHPLTIEGTHAVTAPNEAPVADAQVVDAVRLAATPITLTATDANDDPITYTVIDQPSKGLVSCTPGGACTYTSAAGETGDDSFRFSAQDDRGKAGSATITIHLVNTAPVADDQSVAAQRRVATPIALTASDANGDVVSYAIATAPVKGDVSCTGPACTYTSAAGATGSDSFTFTADDGHGGTDTGAVSIDLTNSSPQAVSQALSARVHVVTPIVVTATDENEDELAFAVAVAPTKGAATCSASGACSYRSDVGATGTDRFTFSVDDGHGGFSLGTVDLSLSNDAPVAQPQAVAAPRRVPTAIVLGASDPNDDPMTFTVTTEPAKGSITCGGSGGASCTYTSAPGATGTDHVGFTVSDGTTTDAAVVTITLTNTAPSAAAASISATTGVGRPIGLAGGDPNEDALTFSPVTLPTRGTLSCGGADGSSCTYTASSLGGIDSFTYVATDAFGASSPPATVSIAIALPALAAGDGSVLEPEASSAGMYVPLTLEAPLPQAVTVRYHTIDGSAAAVGGDYLRSGSAGSLQSLRIAAGQSWAALGLQVNADATVEPDESFSVRIVDASLADGTPLPVRDATATVTILDSTHPGTEPMLAVQDTAAYEGDAASASLVRGQYVVRFSKHVTSSFVLNYRTVGGTATQGAVPASGVDVRGPISGSILVTPTSALSTVLDVAIFGDAAVEADETQFLQVLLPDGVQVIQKAPQGQLTILDDDT